jgi:hypothetical protein
MEPDGSLLCSREPATGPYPKPRESLTPSHPTRYFLILYFYLHLISFLRVYFQTTLLPSIQERLCVCLYGIYVFAQ